MADFIKDESKVGAMLRFLSGDIGVSFKKNLLKLYEDTEVGKACAEWHWMLVKYSKDPRTVRKYVAIIQYFDEYQINPNNLQSWIKTMRIVLPEEFIDKMTSFTQVPQLAIMDEGHEERMKENKEQKIRDASEVLW